MCSLGERPALTTFNVHAKPFEMFLPGSSPPLLRDLMASNAGSFSSDTSDCSSCGNEGVIAASPSTSNNVEGLDLDLSDPLSDDNEASFVPPDNDLRNRIVKQVEFYFSDVNLTKDAFLLKHVKRNKDGYVSLKLIASFKKVKSLTKDWRAVAYSLKNSDKLEMNETGSKVKRKEALPAYDESTPQRTIIAMNLPLERPCIETVSELFAKCGDIALIRILRPGLPLPPDVKQYTNKHLGLGNSLCALVEFATIEAAQKAVRDMGAKNNDWRSMHVVEMVKDATKKAKMPNQQQQQTQTKKEVVKPANGEANPKDDGGKKKNKKRNPKSEQGESNNGVGISPHGRRKANSTSCDQAFSSSPISDSPLAQLNGRLQQHHRMSALTSPEFRHRQKSASISEGVVSGSENGGNHNSPWVQRRLMAAKENGQSPLAMSRRVEIVKTGQIQATKLLVPEGVVRLPKGPDGTNGFHQGKRDYIHEELSIGLITV